MDTAPAPIKIQVEHTQRHIEITFDNDENYQLDFEYLRVYSPSAEVRGHAPEEYTLQHGKQDVGIKHIEAQGNYAICIHFDDGHNTGIYTWEWLYELATEYEQKWKSYLAELDAAGKTRRPPMLNVLT